MDRIYVTQPIILKSYSASIFLWLGKEKNTMKKLSKLLLSIATVVCFVLGMQQTINAKQIDVSGLNANDAVVTNSDGQVVDPDTAPGT